LDVVGSDAYAAGWHASAAERENNQERSTMADRWADLAAVSWRRELEFFADVGEVVVEGDLGEIAEAVERFAAARRAWGNAAERQAAGVGSAGDLARAQALASSAGLGIEYRVCEALSEGADPPPWPRPGAELLRRGGPFGVYAAADASLDARVSERFAQLVLDEVTGRDTRAWCAAVEDLIGDSRGGIAGECGPAGATEEPSRAWWLRRTSEVARGWRCSLWGQIPYSYVQAPVDDVDWMRPSTLWEW
jgi:hypothetical protein